MTISVRDRAEAVNELFACHLDIDQLYIILKLLKVNNRFIERSINRIEPSIEYIVNEFLNLKNQCLIESWNFNNIVDSLFEEIQISTDRKFKTATKRKLNKLILLKVENSTVGGIDYVLSSIKNDLSRTMLSKIKTIREAKLKLEQL